MTTTTTTTTNPPNSSGGVDRYWEAINRNATQITAHEAMCEERSKTIFNTLTRIDNSLDLMNKRMFQLGMTFMAGMAGLIITLVL
ncbi:MAG: hypothetical protein ACPHEP_09830 [Acidimicrobiales bacterium]